MRLKKKVKVFLAILLIIMCAVLGFLVYKNFFVKEVQEAKVINSIKGFGYTLKDNKNETYKKMFYELKDILTSENIDYDKYAKKISEMFIYDFYSLDDKVAKNDIGGVDFIHPKALNNFLVNAESTYYKYVESNVYGNRNQSLPMVNKVTIGEPESTEFALGEENVDDAVKLTANWTYTEESTYDDYQNEATLILVRDGKKLQIVELSKVE